MEQSALLAESVEIIDPTHQFYGLTLPLLEISVKEPLGPVCVVRLRPNVKRLIPLAATNLGGVFPPASPCRLSVAAATALLSVVASLPPFGQEDAHAQHAPARALTAPHADSAPIGSALGSARSAPVDHATSTGDHPDDPAGLDHLVAHGPGTPTSDHAADSPGGGSCCS